MTQANITPKHAADLVEHLLSHWAFRMSVGEKLETLEPEVVDPDNTTDDTLEVLRPHLRACRDAAYKAGRDEYDVRFGWDTDERVVGVYLNDGGTWYRVAHEVQS